jgi:hypothetical protein
MISMMAAQKERQTTSSKKHSTLWDIDKFMWTHSVGRIIWIMTITLNTIVKVCHVTEESMNQCGR